MASPAHATPAAVPTARPSPAEDLECIRCPDCGRVDPAPEGAALIFSLRAPCPECGGRECEYVASARRIRPVA